MKSELICFESACRKRFAITDVIYNCPACGGLLEVHYEDKITAPAELKQTWRDRRRNNCIIDQSGVWRYRELIPFLEDYRQVVTLREGNTPLLDAPRAAQFAGMD